MDIKNVSREDIGEEAAKRQLHGNEVITPSTYLASRSRIRISDFREAKRRKDKWTMLTSYDATSAKIFDKAKIPCLLIGDSAAQTVYGYKSTLQVTLDELIPLAKAVSSNCERALIVADLPFGSYQESPEVALRSAIRFMKESHVHAIKLEGGKEMAHIGFTPQSKHTLSGFKVQGRGDHGLDKLMEDAIALQEAGAFACVLELVPSEAGRLVTEALKIPTIGIGAGPYCDGQVLVWHDMAGFTSPCGQTGGYLYGLDKKAQENGEQSNKATLELNRVPKFVKRYANLSEILFEAAKSFASDVACGNYPAEEHCYK